MGTHLRHGLMASLALSMIGNTHFYAKGGSGAAAKTDSKDHGVDDKHKNPGVTADTPNHADTPGDKPKVEPGKDTGEREPRTGDGSQAKASKSIVPSKYAGKYKGGGSDPLARFLTEHSQDPEKKEFTFDRFFTIMRNNGIADEHVKPFEKAIADKAQGAAGRARMTLRNRLDSVVRQNGHVVGHDGKKHEMKLEPRANARPPKPAEGEAHPAKESLAA